MTKTKKFKKVVDWGRSDNIEYLLVLFGEMFMSIVGLVFYVISEEFLLFCLLVLIFPIISAYIVFNQREVYFKEVKE